MKKTQIFALLLALMLVFAACAEAEPQSSEAEAQFTEKFYDFKDFAACKDDFFYVYSPICKAYGEFLQDSDGIVNFENDLSVSQSAADADVPEYFPDNPDKFAYISLMTNEKYSAGTEATLHCSFDEMGAPLIAFTDDIDTSGEHNIYGLHFEVVAYNDGCNVWRIVPSKEAKEWPIDPTLIAEPKFHIDDKEPVEITVRFGDKQIEACVNGEWTTVELPDMPESFHIGFTACEGINHFYDFSIKSPIK